MSPHEKGRELENTVQSIEAVILESSPALRERPFTIKPRKIIERNGVHHEIDVFVTVEIATGYTSIFIFECKNWQAAVGKNEIVLFADKVEATGAQCGYFIAKSFTKDAYARALGEPRLKLLAVTERDPAATITPASFHFVSQVPTKCSIRFRSKGSSGKDFDRLEIQGTIVQLRGTDMLLGDYVNSWMNEVNKRQLSQFQTASLPEDIYPIRASAERFFSAAEVQINGREMEYAQIETEFEVHVARPAVISDYEVATRGRVIRLAEAKVLNAVIDTSFVFARTS